MSPVRQARVTPGIPTDQDITTILTDVARVDWHEIGRRGQPPFLNGWSNTPGTWAPCRYRQTANSTVYVEGVVTHDGPIYDQDAPSPIFKLPPAALPGGDLMYIVASGLSPSSGPTISTVHVLADGTVAWGGYVTVGEGAEGYVSLCGIAFSIQEATQ